MGDPNKAETPERPKKEPQEAPETAPKMLQNCLPRVPTSLFGPQDWYGDGQRLNIQSGSGAIRNGPILRAPGTFFRST